MHIPHQLPLDTDVACDYEFASSVGVSRPRKSLVIQANENGVTFVVKQGSGTDKTIVCATSSRIEAIEKYNELP